MGFFFFHLHAGFLYTCLSRTFDIVINNRDAIRLHRISHFPDIRLEARVCPQFFFFRLMIRHILHVASFGICGMVHTYWAWGAIGSFGWLITNTVCNDVCISIVFMLWFITYNYWHFCCNAWTLERNNSWLEHGNVEMKNMSKHCNMFKQFIFKIFIDLRNAKNCRKNWSLHIELIAHYMYNEKPSGSIKPQITWYEDFAIVMLIFECSILH